MRVDVDGGRGELARQMLEQALATIDELREEIKALREENKRLHQRLGINSRNSSMPPSKDAFGRPVQKSLRKKTGRSAGKQSGAEGRWLEQVTNPDAVITHEPDQCKKCGISLAAGPVSGVERRQVFDIPPITRVVTEHQAFEKLCACGQRTRAFFPKDVTNYVTYGPNVRATAVYMLARQHVPFLRCAEFLTDVLGVGVSEGWVAGQLARAKKLVAAPLETIRAGVKKAQVLHCDETVCRVGGKNRYVHVASTQHLTLFHGPAGRGNEAMNAFGILPDYQGVMVHDGLAQYRKYDTAHGLCNVHHLRELTWVSENTDQPFATEMIAFLKNLHKTVKDHKEQGKSGLDPEDRANYKRRYDNLIQQGMAQHPPENKRKLGKTRSLIERLHTFAEDVLRFAWDFRVPFHNNQAEQDVRMIKLQDKISGRWRTHNGAAAFLDIRSYINTAIKQAHNPLTAIKSLYTNNPWTPTTTP